MATTPPSISTRHPSPPQVPLPPPATARKGGRSNLSTHKTPTLPFDYDTWDSAIGFCQQIMYADEAQWHEEADAVEPFLRRLFAATPKPEGDQETEGLKKYHLAPKTHVGVLEQALGKWREATTLTPQMETETDPMEVDKAPGMMEIDAAPEEPKEPREDEGVELSEEERRTRRRATKALVLLIFPALRKAFDAISLKKKGMSKEEADLWRVQLERIRQEAVDMTPAPPKPRPFRLMDGVGM